MVELDSYAIHLANLCAQIPTFPKALDSSFLERVIRRGDAHLHYMTSLTQPSSLTTHRISTIKYK